MAQHEGSWKIFKYVLLGVFVLGGVMFFVLWGGEIGVWMNNRGLRATFGDQLKNYYDQAQGVISKAGGAERAPESPARAGKALWVNVKEIVRRSSRERSFSIDRDAGRLPDELRAETPEEVQTVVLVYEDTGSVGVYRTKGGITGPDARMRWLNVLVVDIKNKRYLGQKRFEWNVKKSIQLGERGAADRNSEEVIQWYVSLPAK
jgi:hypothetical protein